MGQFPTTRWTLAMASARVQSQTGRAALAILSETYWYPLYALARRRDRPGERGKPLSTRLSHGREDLPGPLRAETPGLRADSEIHQLCEGLVATEEWTMP